MTEKSKQLRIVLSADEMAKVREVRARLESQAGVKLTDTQFVVGLVRRALANE